MDNLVAIPYYGGKARTDFRKWLLPKIPYDSSGLYVEPFAGMLGVLLARPKCKIEVINDLDANIYTWWKVVREQPDELTHLIYGTPKCRRTFYDARDAIKTKRYKDDQLMWAWATFTALNYNVAHGTGAGGFGTHFQGNGAKRDFTKVIGPLAERLKNVQIENRDALILLERLEKFDHAVIYCDPPYLTADTKAYKLDDEGINVEAYTKTLLAQKGRVAISGYRDEWDHLGWQRFEWDTRAYPLNDSDEHRDLDWNRTEVLWTNYEVADDQLDLF